MQIYIYYLYQFNKKEPIELSQIEGQKILMALINNPEKKFILVGETLINTSSIEDIRRERKMYIDIESGRQNSLPEIRELTKEEQETQDKFDDFRGYKLIK